MDLGIQSKIALVTGGSKGLGRAAALSLAKEGVRIAICARTQDTLDNTVAELRELGTEAIGVVADMLEPTAPSQLHQYVVDELGPIDILVNNVGGVLSRTDFSGTSTEDFKRTFDLNTFNAFDLCKLTVPHMKEQQWGRVINIASIFGREYGGVISYMGAKAAMIAMGKSLAIELCGHGITVNSVAPGSILFSGGVWDRFQQTQSPETVQKFIEQNLPFGKFGTPEPVGDLVTYLASQNARLITGTCINIDGGQSRSLI
ncbi:SDR family oxidoreductase [Chloroflexi bacterium TSY]|nr:SDR family oxidoreductase [Chloroflexi bacterium TSY]